MHDDSTSKEREIVVGFPGSGNKRLTISLNLGVLILALVCMSRQSSLVKQTSTFENLMVDSFAPMQRVVTVLHSWTTTIFSNYLYNVKASKENINLNSKIAELENQIFLYQELGRENRRLKKLLRFNKTITGRKVLAQVVAWDASSDFKVIRINKGSNDKIRLQSIVFTAEGLVGYVYRLTFNFADVLTVLDTSNRIDGIIERTRSHGIVEGHRSIPGKCAMKFVTRTEPIIINDRVLTSGLGNIYPKGILIGTVTRIERESYGITQDIDITPIVNMGQLEEVIVLLPAENSLKQKEWQALDSYEKNRKVK